jgi:hypothetical protein
MSISLIKPDSSVTIVSTIDVKIAESRLDSRNGIRSLFKAAETSVGPAASQPMDAGHSFLGRKDPESEAQRSPPSSCEVKNIWSYTSIP